MEAKRKIWESDFNFRTLGIICFFVACLSSVLIYLGIIEYEDITLHIIFLALSVGIGIPCIPLSKKQKKWREQEKERAQKSWEKVIKMREKEEEEKRKEAARCPVCKKEDALVKETYLVGHRLVGVRDGYDSYFNVKYEIEDYEDRYRTTIKCRFCDYCKEWEESDRVSIRV